MILYQVTNKKTGKKRYFFAGSESDLSQLVSLSDWEIKKTITSLFIIHLYILFSSLISGRSQKSLILTNFLSSLRSGYSLSEASVVLQKDGIPIFIQYQFASFDAKIAAGCLAEDALQESINLFTAREKALIRNFGGRRLFVLILQSICESRKRREGLTASIIKNVIVLSTIIIIIISWFIIDVSVYGELIKNAYAYSRSSLSDRYPVLVYINLFQLDLSFWFWSIFFVILGALSFRWLAKIRAINIFVQRMFLFLPYIRTIVRVRNAFWFCDFFIIFMKSGLDRFTVLSMSPFFVKNSFYSDQIEKIVQNINSGALFRQEIENISFLTQTEKSCFLNDLSQSDFTQNLTALRDFLFNKSVVLDSMVNFVVRLAFIFIGMFLLGWYTLVQYYLFVDFA